MGIIKDLIVGGQQRKSAKKASREIREGGKKAIGFLDPFAEGGGRANEAILGALGQGEPGAQDEAFQNFLGSTGFRSQLQAGSQAITGSAASRGLISSGATLKRQTQFGQNLAQGGFSNFLSQLGSVAGRGLSAAQGQASVASGTAARSAQTTQAGRDAFTSGVGSGLDRLSDAATFGFGG